MEEEINKNLLLKKDPGAAEEDLKFKDKLWKESKKMWIVAGPAIFTRFSTFGVNVITQAFVGHIGSTELAAYALVSTVLLRFANGILEHLAGEGYNEGEYRRDRPKSYGSSHFFNSFALESLILEPLT